VQEQGLTTEAAVALLSSHGPNGLPEAAAESWLAKLLRQFRSPLIYILLVALAVDLVLWYREGARGVPVESIAIAAILALNAVLGFWQELKAEDALGRLRDLSAPQAWILRDGAWIRLPAQDIVPGDQVRLESGDRIPADGLLYASTEAMNLSIDESILTGESLPVDKQTGNEAFSGTLVVRGRASLNVTRTGPGSALGKLASMLGGIHEETTPLERKMAAFGNRVARWVLLVVALMFLGGIATRGMEHLSEILLLSVALAVAAVPEGLPAVLSFALALGVERMAGRKAIVRRLAAVEALGSVTTIVTDKTGTLTENRMTVAALDGPDEPALIHALAIANDAVGSAGDPEDLALLRFAQEHGSEPKAKRVSAQPFDSSARFMRVSVEENGVVNSYLKGAPEAMLERCKLDPAEKKTWHQRALALAAKGYRVLAAAQGDGESDQNLRLLGLVSLWDPPRAEVADALRIAREGHVRVILATGDHPATAVAIAEQIGFQNPTVRTGADLDLLSPADFAQAASTTDVFARVTPKHKFALIEHIQSQGQIVAMTGDGVNDAPALKRADVGIAMGQRGSDVTREVADIVLSDDNFATIIAAIEEGRGIYANVQKFVRFLFSTNLAEILVIALGSLLAVVLDLRDPANDYLVPLTAVQILWINLVTDGLPAMALALDRDLGAMSRRPRPPEENLLDGPSARYIIIAGSTAAVVALGLLGLVSVVDWSYATAQTATFQYLAIVQLFFAYAARRVGSRPAPNRVLHLAVAGGCALQIAASLFTPASRALNLAPLDFTAWGIIASAVLISWGIADFTARHIRTDA
jgi:P-type Ca2+ transporter type 2C